jgi:4-aminobutyrate aminotransferase-like enzyme
MEWVRDSETREADSSGAAAFAERMKDKGFLMANAGQRGNVIKIRPPLIFEQSHAELLLEALTETVEEIHAGA